jgi:hypothetical protein
MVDGYECTDDGDLRFEFEDDDGDPLRLPDGPRVKFIVRDPDTDQTLFLMVVREGVSYESVSPVVYKGFDGTTKITEKFNQRVRWNPHKGQYGFDARDEYRLDDDFEPILAIFCNTDSDTATNAFGATVDRAFAGGRSCDVRPSEIAATAEAQQLLIRQLQYNGAQLTAACADHDEALMDVLRSAFYSQLASKKRGNIEHWRPIFITCWKQGSASKGVEGVLDPRGCLCRPP